MDNKIKVLATCFIIAMLLTSGLFLYIFDQLEQERTNNLNIQARQAIEIGIVRYELSLLQANFTAYKNLTNNQLIQLRMDLANLSSELSCLEVKESNLQFQVDNHSIQIINILAKINIIQARIENISKTPGPMGPQGPKGDKGDKGDRGDTGSSGQNGKDVAWTLVGTYYSDTTINIDKTEIKASWYNTGTNHMDLSGIVTATLRGNGTQSWDCTAGALRIAFHGCHVTIWKR